MKGHTPTGGLIVHRADLIGVGGPDAVRDGAVALRGRIEGAGEGIEPREELVERRRREPPLRPLERPADRPGGVKRLEQHDPDPGVRRRAEHHLIECVVLPALVVYVVEFSDGGDARIAHFQKRLKRQPVRGRPVE